MARALALYAAVASAGLLRSTASAYSWQFTSTPQQCQNLTLSLIGSGTAPYSILVIPFGPSPLPNNTEVRRIFSTQFNGSSTTFSLPYPADSQFVAVVSDSSGFGSGGTSVAATVQSSSDASCFNASAQVEPDFSFSIVPSNQIVECSPTRIWWDPSLVQGTPTFQGIIPGGQSFSVPETNFSTVAEQGYGFSWTPSLRIGTTVIITGGDDRGPGTAGSGLYIVSQGSTQSCLSSDSPSSTPGSPAGGSYPTSTNGLDSSDGSTSSGHSNVGAIVGGVMGGVCGFLIALAIVGVLLWRRRKGTHSKGLPVDLLQGPSEEGGASSERLPRYYEPEPFMLPDPSSTGVPSEYTYPMSEHRSSAGFLGAAGRPGTPSATSTGRTGRTGKSGMPPSLRPVNIVQHEDAGPPPDEEEQEETVELPPAYTNLKRGPPPPADDEQVPSPLPEAEETARA